MKKKIKKKKYFILASILVVSIFMASGYSILSQRIDISANANLYASKTQLWNKILTQYGTNTSNGLIKSNDENNRYYYSGESNNYISLNDELFRIISIENDNTIKIISTNPINIEFDNINNRTSSSTYCTEVINNKGCNSWNSKETLTNNSINGSVENESTINNTLSNYYSTLNDDIKNIIVEHNFNIGSVKTNDNITSVLSSEINNSWNGYIGLINVSDILNSYDQINIANNNLSGNTYLSEILNTNNLLWTMNMLDDNSSMVWVYETNKLKTIDASISSYEENETNHYINAYPVMYLSSLTKYKEGNGTYSNPFIIKK